MLLIGYLALFDPPQDSAKAAVKTLSDYGVKTKVLMGDIEKVAVAICRHVGLDADTILLGSDIENMSDARLSQEVKRCDIFAIA